MIRTVNNAIRTLLFQAKMPPSYWPEALHAVVHVLNILPSSAIGAKTPHFLIYGKHPTYDHLRTFRCLAFPNMNHSPAHKLSPRSTPCLFLGYPIHHRGYRCLDLKTNRIIISRHVIFDESTFPAAKPEPQTGSWIASKPPLPCLGQYLRLLRCNLHQRALPLLLLFLHLKYLP